MAKSKHRQKRPQNPLRYDPRETDAALSEDLRQALKAMLTLQQLCELEKQLRRSLETATKKSREGRDRGSLQACFRLCVPCAA